MNSSPQGSFVDRLAPSPEQRVAIEAEGCDVVVTAGAGTGKTRTLVARYLRLLDEGVQPRRIVAITFTKKAAREMRNRVREAIRERLWSPDLHPAGRRKWRDLYTALDAARIGTIHSLCTEILRAHPAEAGLDPRFEVMDEVEAALVNVEVLDAAMAWAAEDESASRWFEHLGDLKLRSLLEGLLRARADTAEAFDSVVDDPLGHWRTTLHSDQRDRLRALGSDPEWASAVADLGYFVADNPADTFDERRRAALGAIVGIQVAIAQSEGGGGSRQVDDLDDFEAAIEVANRDVGGVSFGSGGWSHKNWPGGAEDLASVKAALGHLKTEWNTDKLLGLRIGPADEALAADMPALRAVFDYMLETLRAHKRERNRLDFDDLETMARDLLRDYASVRERWNEEIHAIMVDEFQDTNARQREIVEHLALPGRRFYVGDAKQSIYRFRGADVTGMRTVRSAVEAESGTSIGLATSYRSHEALVEAQNDIFAAVLGQEEDPAKPFVEPFSPLVAHRKEAPQGLDGPFVELHLALGTKGDGALRRAAEGLVDRLIELVEDGRIMLEDEGGDGRSRKLDYGDIVILCRSSGAFEVYETALARAGVPYVTVAGRGYYDRPEVRDLLNALRAIADPHDDSALIGLLRSPAFAVSDPGLYGLCRERDRSTDDAQGRTSLWDQLGRTVRGLDGVEVEAATTADRSLDGFGANSAIAERPLGGSGIETVIDDLPDPISDQDLERMGRAWGATERLRALAGRVTVGELLAAFMDMTAYLAILRLAGDHRAARNVDKLLNAARDSRLVGVGDFVDWVSTVTTASDRESEARAVVEGMVRIFTIHSAKGLEFPIVVLGDMAAKPSGGRNGLLIDRELGVLPKLADEEETVAAAFSLAQLRDDERDDAETKRLLYVAITRAKDLVLLSGTAGRKKDGELAAHTGWLGTLTDVLGLDTLDAGSIDPASSAAVARMLRPVVAAAARLYPEGYTAERQAKAIDGPTTESGLESRSGSRSENESGSESESGSGIQSESGAESIKSPTRPRVSLVAPITLQSARLSADEDAIEARRDPPRRVWRVVPEADRRARPPAWVVGTLVHRAIERWRFPGQDSALREWLVAITHELGIIDRREADSAVNRSITLLERFEDHPMHRALDTAPRRLHEVPFVGGGSMGRHREGKIDLLYELNGKWTIVDFKADEVRRHNLAQFKATLMDPEDGYVRQVTGYAEAVQSLLGDAPPRALLCLLDFEDGVRLFEVRDNASAQEILESTPVP